MQGITITKLCQGLSVNVVWSNGRLQVDSFGSILTVSTRRASIPHVLFLRTLKNNQEKPHR